MIISTADGKGTGGDKEGGNESGGCEREEVGSEGSLDVGKVGDVKGDRDRAMVDGRGIFCSWQVSGICLNFPQ